MPRFLAAAIEASRATAAAVTWLAESGRRRSYSANFDVDAARRAVQELVDANAAHVVSRRDAEPTAPLGRYERLIVPIRARGRVGALGVYWDDAPPVDVAAVAGELEQLVTATFGAESYGQESRPGGPDFHATLDLPPLVRTIAEAAVTRCAADGAAAAVHEPGDGDPVVGTVQLADYEQRWVDPIVSAEASVPSITRYVDPYGSGQDDPDDAIATMIVVPLRDGEDESVGNVVAVWRRDLRDDVDIQLSELEAIAEDARPALDNAIRFRRLQALAVRDPATGVFDQRYFAGALADACGAAESVLVVAAAAVDLADVGTPIEIAALERSLNGVAARFAAVVGDRGVACRVNLGTLAAIVRGSTAATGSALVEELRAVLLEPPAHEPAPTWQLAAVERAPTDDADALWSRTLDALAPVGRAADAARLAGATSR
jgi:GGDEF domain-containing protein